MHEIAWWLAFWTDKFNKESGVQIPARTEIFCTIYTLWQLSSNGGEGQDWTVATRPHEFRLRNIKLLTV